MCRYEPFLVAEAAFDASPEKSDPAGKGGQAFRDLAGFLFGKNKQQAKMSMTTPVLTDSRGAMQFVLPESIKVSCWATMRTSICVAWLGLQALVPLKRP